MSRLFTLIILTICIQVNAQPNGYDADRFGVYANLDEAYDFSDHVITGITDRKISIGGTFAGKNGKHVAFLGFGVRLSKATIISPSFTSSFAEDLNENYSPISSGGYDSLVGAAMSQGGYFRGTTGGWLHASFVWVNRYRPSISFYYGGKGMPSYGPGFVEYIDPEYHDIEYAQLGLKFYELRFACSPPFLNKRGWPFSICINAGYRLNDYKDFIVSSYETVNDVPMNSYTNDNFVKKHRFASCFTLALSFTFWSNWTWD